jgi:hypothetical protein
MPEPIDPVAAAMAKAAGMNIVDHNDPIEPKPVDPVEPVDPVDPIEPADPVDPVDPSKPVEPVDPKVADPVIPKDPTKTIPKDPPVDSDFGTLLSSKTGGRFKSIDEIDAALAAAPESAFANEQISKLNAFVKQGGKMDDYLRTQTADYSTMSDAEVIAQSMKVFNKKGLDADEIEFLMTEKYGITEGSTEAQKKMARINLKSDAADARDRLLEHQEKWKVPQVSDQEKIDAQSAQLEEWKGSLNSGVDGTEKVSIKITNDVSFDYKLDDSAKSAIKNGYADPRKFFDRYVKADGTNDVQKFVREMAIIENFDKIAPALAAFGKSEGVEGVLKDIVNPDFEAKSKGAPQGGPSSLQDQALKAMGLK